MSLETISESTFLLTELRYTLGQLHVQVLDLDPEARGSALRGERSVDQILSDLVAAEDTWQARYADILHSGAPDEGTTARIPLPVNEQEETPGVESTFEHKRAQTIAMLEAVEGTWPSALLSAVKDQVTEDRKITTEIAECRKVYLSRAQRTDLVEPLTAEPTPQP